MLETVDHADTGKSITIAGTPIKFSESASGVTQRAPLLGEHTEAVLNDADVPPEVRERILDSLADRRGED